MFEKVKKTVILGDFYALLSPQIKTNVANFLCQKMRIGSKNIFRKFQHHICNTKIGGSKKPQKMPKFDELK